MSVPPTKVTQQQAQSTRDKKEKKEKERKEKREKKENKNISDATWFSLLFISHSISWFFLHVFFFD
jgi:ribosomal protein L12E/L44/L45/RPP1/RPP2